MTLVKEISRQEWVKINMLDLAPAASDDDKCI